MVNNSRFTIHKSNRHFILSIILVIIFYQIIRSDLRADDAYAQLGIKRFYVKNYHKPGSFPFPDYDKKEIKKSTLPDQRSTIYWNENIFIGRDKATKINFFSSDDAGTYTVIVSGVTARGDLLYKEIKINESL